LPYFRRSKGGSVEAAYRMRSLRKVRSISADQKAAPLKLVQQEESKLKNKIYFRRSKGGSVEAAIEDCLREKELSLFPPIKRRLR